MKQEIEEIEEEVREMYWRLKELRERLTAIEKNWENAGTEEDEEEADIEARTIYNNYLSIYDHLGLIADEIKKFLRFPKNC